MAASNDGGSPRYNDDCELGRQEALSGHWFLQLKNSFKKIKSKFDIQKNAKSALIDRFEAIAAT